MNVFDLPRAQCDQCDHTHTPHSETVWAWLRSEQRCDERSRDQRPGLVTPVTGVTITWHRVKTDKTNLSNISNILKFFTQKKTWTASVRQLAVSVQCGVQVELCYFIDIKIVLCEDKATVQNYCHILAQNSHDKTFFLVSCFVAQCSSRKT